MKEIDRLLKQWIFSTIIRETIRKAIIEYGNYKMGQNEKLIKNMKEYGEKKEAKQHKPEVLGQEATKRKTNKKKNTRMYHS